MSLDYRAVGWNANKRRYDAVLLAAVVLFVGAFVGLGAVLDRQATAETLLIRAFGTAAFLLLHVILVIGPLCRLDPRLLPLLYNRRHMGVTMFVLALAHGVFATVQFHAFGDAHPVVSILTANPRYDELAAFPFQPLGLAALVILFLMAATSHDFWLANLGAPAWKALHMLVYVAYGLLVMHVALGALQSQTHPALAALVGVGLLVVLGLHAVAGRRERALDVERDTTPATGDAGFVDVGAVDEIPDGRAKVVTLAGDRVAVFRYGDRLSAVSNACQHQNGPLGEGRVVDGCIVCPWHGYQYLPDCGRSPEPFREKVPTFAVKVAAGRVLVEARPHPAGTRLEPALVPGGASSPRGSRR